MGLWVRARGGAWCGLSARRPPQVTSVTGVPLLAACRYDATRRCYGSGNSGSLPEVRTGVDEPLCAVLVRPELAHAPEQPPVAEAHPDQAVLVGRVGPARDVTGFHGGTSQARRSGASGPRRCALPVLRPVAVDARV